ncbi:unnamed protein product [Prunus armeniaca]
MRCFVRNLTREREKRKAGFFRQLPEKQIGEEDEQCTRDLEAQHPPFPRLCSGSFYSWFAVFSSFLSSVLTKSDERKAVKMHTGPRDVSDSMRDSTH